MRRSPRRSTEFIKISDKIQINSETREGVIKILNKEKTTNGRNFKKLLVGGATAAIIFGSILPSAFAAPKVTVPGWGFGDENHVHVGPPGHSVHPGDNDNDDQGENDNGNDNNDKGGKNGGDNNSASAFNERLKQLFAQIFANFFHNHS